MKHASGHCGVGTTLEKWGVQDNTDCPRCQKEETTQHVLLCRSKDALTVWETGLVKLDAWMLQKQTDPAIRLSITSRLRTWHEGTPPSGPSWDCTFKSAIKEQNAIGWYPFLLGQVSLQWKGAQHACYKSLNLDNTGKQWVKQLILQLFNISWDMWEHHNGIKHNTNTPAKQRKIHLLNQHIVSEVEVGTISLLLRDHRWLQGSADALIATFNTVQKLQWLESVANAHLWWSQQRSLQPASQDASQQLLHQWLHPP
jgi:hypothetical protein